MPSMQICYPCGTGDCPPDLVAWGSYTAGANPTGTCTMSRNGAQVQQVPVTFRTDGTWFATFAGLAANSAYSCDAQVTAGGVTTNAQQESPIEVSAMAMPMPVPIQMGGPGGGPVPPPSSGPPGAGTVAAAGAGGGVALAGVGGEPLKLTGEYDPFSGIESLVTVLVQKSNSKAHSVLQQTLHFGHYSLVVPRPADLTAANGYRVNCIFLDDRGLKVEHSVSNFPL